MVWIQFKWQNSSKTWRFGRVIYSTFLQQTFGALSATLAQYLTKKSLITDTAFDSNSTEYYQFECFPEYAQLQQRLTHIQTLEIPNPYFQMQESLIGIALRFRDVH